MKKYIIVSVLLVAFVFFNSCRNDNKEDLLNYNATISIIEPEEGAIFNSGEELHMEVDFDATKAIGNYEVLALNNTSGDTIAHFTSTSIEKFLSFHEHHEDLLVTEVSDCILTASVWETDYADRISASVSFTINP